MMRSAFAFGLLIGALLGSTLGAAYVAWAVQSRPVHIEHQQALLCWHEVATNAYYNPAGCPEL